MKYSTVIALAVAGALIGAGIWWMVQGRYHGMNGMDHRMTGMGVNAASRPAGAAQPGDPVVPDLTAMAERGRVLFEANCSACHGENALGSDDGPPLIHKIYEPSHHGDASFYMAVANGVRPHHWRFGPMPKIEGVGEEDVKEIIAYVRELQRANGIH